MTSTYNIRKEFLGESSGFRNGQFNPALDEPTYLTFKLDFFSDEMNTNLSFLYDSLPQALFSIGTQGPKFANNIDVIEMWDPDLSDFTSFINDFRSAGIFTPEGFSTDRPYSALEYLYSRNEDYRCYLLAKFLKGWNDLQTKYQYYFQEIDGLDELFKSDPSKGQKIEKSHTITIKCLEGIDQKVKYLLSLYKAAAWDDHYQRWILPDIYRYFKLDIYISEIRTFHQSVYAQTPLDPTGMYSASFLPGLYSDRGSVAKAIDNFAGKIVDKVTGKVFTTLDKWTEGGIHSNIKEDNFVLGIVKGFVPVTCLRCSLCDFDINYNTYQSGYSINNDQMETTAIKIKVRQAEEIHNWRMVDPYRNLLNNSERQFGQQSLKAIVKIGDLADQYFNETLNLPPDDRNHYYTASIGSGWITSGIQRIADTVLNENNGILDKVYDTYEAVRDSISQKRATKENYEISHATNNDEYTLEDYKKDFGTTVENGRDILNNPKMISKAVKDEFDSSFMIGDNIISPYGSSYAINAFHSIAANDPSTYSYLIALSHHFELDPSFNGIVRTKNGSMIQPKLHDDLSLSTDLDSSMSISKSFENNRGQMTWTSSEYRSSVATNSSISETPVFQNSASLLNSIENGTLTYGSLSEYLSSNKSSISEEDTNLVSIYDNNDSFIKPTQSIDLSDKSNTTLVDISGNMISNDKIEDRSIATDLDIEKELQFTGLYNDIVNSSVPLVGLSQATSLDFTPISVYPLISNNNESILKGELVALLYDNLPFFSANSLMSIESQEITNNFKSYDLIEIPLISMLNDYKLLDVYIPNEIDRSLATDLDNDTSWNVQHYKAIEALTKPIDKGLSSFEYISLQGIIDNTNDRSIATDLDEMPDTKTIEENLTSIKLVQNANKANDGSDTMTWVNQETTSLFNSIAELQRLPQETSPIQENIETRLIEKESEPRAFIEEDLFSNVVKNMSTATSSKTIEKQELIGNTNISSATNHDIVLQYNNIDNVPVRELIKVALIDYSKKEEKIQEIKLIDNSTKKSIIL